MRRRKPQFPPQACVAPRRIEDLRIDAERLQGHPLQPEAAQVIAHDVARRAAPGRSARTASGGIGPRRVRASEPQRVPTSRGRCEWKNATTGTGRRCAHRHRAPGRMKGITGFDQIGLQRLEHLCPASRHQRQPVIERAGHLDAGKRADAAALDVGRIARHQQRVLPVFLGLHPGVLGIQVAPDAAAGRRIKQCGVNQMHADPEQRREGIAPARCSLVKVAGRWLRRIRDGKAADARSRHRVRAGAG